MNAIGNVLLDTNIIVAHLRQESDLSAKLAQAGALYIPLVVLGELFSLIPGLKTLAW